MFRRWLSVVLSVMILFSFMSCSKKADEEAEKKHGNEFTRKVAEEGLKTIQVPIDKAKELDAKMAERNRKMAEEIEEN